eukprot:s2961_g5.t1
MPADPHKAKPRAQGAKPKAAKRRQLSFRQVCQQLRIAKFKSKAHDVAALAATMRADQTYSSAVKSVTQELANTTDLLRQLRAGLAGPMQQTVKIKIEGQMREGFRK